MRPNYCLQFLACIMKFLNFFQFFVGISTLIFSAFLLNRWQNRAALPPPAPVPVPGLDSKYIPSINTNAGSIEVMDRIDTFNLSRDFLFSGLELDLEFWLYSAQLPTPWFIYFLMAAGVILVCTSCIGHLAAEAMSGCCLCFYLFLTLVVLILEAVLVPFFAIDHEWEKDLPYDPTGELEKFRFFVHDNADVCKWVGITLVTVQALSLLLSLIMRALISTRQNETNLESGYDSSRKSLLNSQQNQSSGLTKGEGRKNLFGIWVTRIRQKYGLSKESSKEQASNQLGIPATKC